MTTLTITIDTDDPAHQAKHMIMYLADLKADSEDEGYQFEYEIEEKD